MRLWPQYKLPFVFHLHIFSQVKKGSVSSPLTDFISTSPREALTIKITVEAAKAAAVYKEYLVAKTISSTLFLITLCISFLTKKMLWVINSFICLLTV